MKKFRRITIAVLMASMVLALGACGRSNTPTAVVEKQMQQVKEEQMKTELSSLVSDKNVAKKYQKEYKKTVSILCTKNEDGDWETDVDTNSNLKDAMLGGIMTLSSQNSTSSK